MQQGQEECDVPVPVVLFRSLHSPEGGGKTVAGTRDTFFIFGDFWKAGSGDWMSPFVWRHLVGNRSCVSISSRITQDLNNANEN